MLSSVTPDEYSIKIIDDQCENIDFNQECDIVGITTTTPTAHRAYEIADAFRSLGKTVILGGWHSSTLPNESKEHADSVVIGEGEENWPNLLDDYKKNELQPFYQQMHPINMKTVKWPPRRNINHKRGFIIGNVQATRGCTKGCKFCSISNSSSGKKFRSRFIEDIINEIESLPNKIILFNDPSLTNNPKFSKDLFKEMKNLNKRFFCNGNIDILSKDREIIKLASEAGCIGWAIGFESISKESLNQIGKNSNIIDNIDVTIKRLHDYNMSITGHFIFGLDGDSYDIFDKTIDAINKWEIDIANLNILTPFPGTPIFNKYDLEGRIITKDWFLYDLHHVVFRPKLMTPEQLLEGWKRTKDEVYSFNNKIKRSLYSLRFGLHNFFTTGLENFYEK
jgi:radical SAM superfamily enzyme YgiQ (UPF0313 family)